MKALKRHFADHPATVGQTYVQHFAFSALFSLRLFRASFTAIVHAFCPFLFKTRTSRYLNELNKQLQQQHNAE